MLKLAFIGGSLDSIAGYPHFIASQMDKKFEVIAGAFSSDSKKNRQTAKAWSISNYYDNYHELIQKEKGRVDAVVILTPTPLHHQIILELLENEIPIICEKPLVSSLEEIQSIQKVFNPNRHFMVITNNYSGYPMLRELQQKIINQR